MYSRNIHSGDPERDLAFERESKRFQLIFYVLKFYFFVV